MKKLHSMLEEGHRFHPLNEKRPLFKNWQSSNPDHKTLQTWINQGHNIGWIQDRTAALDFDSYDLARNFWREHGPFRVAIQRTLRGVHLCFRNPGHIGNAVKVNGLYDVRGNSGYLCFYGFVENFDTTDPSKLETFRDEWLPNKRQVVRDGVHNVRAYISKIESIEGKHGSAGLIRATAKCRDSGLSQAEAFIELKHWNDGPTVSPPWSDQELARAVTRTYETYKSK